MKEFSIDDIKRFIQLALNGGPTDDQFIDARYQAHINKFEHPMPYYRVFHRLAQELRPSLTVELGGWQGTAAAHFASGCPSGDVVTIDHHGDPGDDENKVKMLEASDRYTNFHYLQGWTWDLLPEVQGIVNQVGTIDILFIDSWHEYEKAKRDWDDYRPLLSPVSLVICDDILPGYGPTISGMMDFWVELPGEKFLNDLVHPGFPMGFIRYVK